MTVYRLDDGKVVDTENATRYWKEDTTWNGSNNVSVHSHSQWDHQTLYRSQKGRYYVEHRSQWSGVMDNVELLSDAEATTWLLLNDDEIPEELQQHIVAVAE